jgi:hypothetical protein
VPVIGMRSVIRGLEILGFVLNLPYPANSSSTTFRDHAGVPLPYKMRFLVMARRYGTVEMRFRNTYMVEYEEAPDGLLDV